MSKYIIYGLRDPRTGEIRYVGKSTSGLTRPQSHTRPSNLKKDCNTYKVKWIKKLLSLDLKPEIVVLSQTQFVQDLHDLERFWIVIGREALGSRLTNLSEGGESGSLGVVRSEAFKEKVSMSVSNYLNRPDVKEVTSAKSKAAWERPEVRERYVAAANTPESVDKRRNNAKLSWENSRETRLASANNPTTKAKKSNSLIRSWTDERKEKASDQTKKRWESSRQDIILAQLEAQRRPEVRAAKSRASREVALKTWRDPVVRYKRIMMRKLRRSLLDMTTGLFSDK